MENFKIELKETQGELVIRQGQAKLLVDPKPVKFTGTFQAVIEWWMIRRAEIAKDLIQYSHLKYSKSEMKIELIVNEQKEYKDILTGLIVKNEDLKGFGINENTSWTIDGFKKTY